MAEHETIADVIAEMRGMGNYQRYSGDHARVLAGRIEAAHKRERGDAAKLREALEYMFILIDERHLVLECETTEEISGVQGKLAEARAALAAPMRNCDRYTTFNDAIRALADKLGWHDGKWNSERYCILAQWLFAPATEEEGGAK